MGVNTRQAQLNGSYSRFTEIILVYTVFRGRGVHCVFAPIRFRKGGNVRSSSDAFKCALNDDDLRSAWPWFLGLGLLLTGLGLLAFTNLVDPESVSIFRVGVMMIIAAAFHSIQTFRVRRWVGFPWRPRNNERRHGTNSQIRTDSAD